MPEEAEVETKELQEAIDEIREERKEESWTRWISLSTALLAVIAAVSALESGTLVNEALLKKNDATDKWSYYQAKGIKGNGAKQTAELMAANPALKERVDYWRNEAKRYKAEQDEIYSDAKKRDEESEMLMHHHHGFAMCVTFTQVAIALSAIAALTRRRPVWYASMLVGGLGLYLFIAGFKELRAHGASHATQHISEGTSAAGHGKEPPAPHH